MVVKIERIEKKIKEACSEIKKLSDVEFGRLVDTGAFDTLLRSISNPKDSKKSKSLQEHLLKNKNRLYLLARLRYAIGENYSFKGEVGETSVYVSPFHYQWLNDGVIFTQGKDKWLGTICYYDKDGDLYLARSKRNFNEGDTIDLRKDLFFDFFYQKIQNMEQIDSGDKKKILNKIEEIEKEGETEKKRNLILKFGKWLDDKTDRIWYQTVKAFFDSLNK